MSTQSIPAGQVSVVFEYVQGKRRLDRVLEAASALLQRVAEEPEPRRRLEISFELIRRHFSDDACLECDGVSLRTTPEASERTAEATADAPSFHVRIEGAAGDAGFLSARYDPNGTLGLTPVEWSAAMRLLARVVALSVGGKAV
ncbi:hypothetical protein HXP44_20765 [Streptomyces sioyaensis]|uniref:hypothetical protein n=1 Tax=Streptomyces sioyaensis TaxID=67364 RepID=UPI001386C37A|nr:hypothetical protein [Streptomyces sioyaensis]MBM4794438.1 hypothetical protein [Streptomyces sioyaensis]